MDTSPLQHHDGVNAASALESLAHRLVAVHHKQTSDVPVRRRVEDVVDVPLFNADDFGLDAPAASPAPAPALSFLDRIRQFFTG